MTGEVPKRRISLGESDEGLMASFVPPLQQSRQSDAIAHGFVTNGIRRNAKGEIRAIRYFHENIDFESDGTSRDVFLENHRIIAEKLGYVVFPDIVVDLEQIAEARVEQ